MRSRIRQRMGAIGLIFIGMTVPRTAPAQSGDDAEVRAPVSATDVRIVERARQILDSPTKWNRADDRLCPIDAMTFSLYCALEAATYDVTGDFAHRGAAMQEARFVIDDDLAPTNTYHHRLMDYNNDPRTTFADVRRFFDLLRGRIAGRLEDEEATARSAPAPAAAPPTQVDIAVVRKVEDLLSSPAKWDRTSSQTCKHGATTFGLYCAFEAASIAVTGKFDDGAPGIATARHLIARTAPNASKYSARLVDYNNDPTVTFEELRKLLHAVEVDLERRAAHRSKN